MKLNIDTTALMLAQAGHMGRNLPPSWDGAKITIPCVTPEGDRFGDLLPGRGLYLRHDLKALGIRRPLPHVYERSPVARTVEALDRWGPSRNIHWDAERAAVRFLHLMRVFSGVLMPACAITNLDGIIAARTGGKGDDTIFAKASITTVANAWSSLVRATGQPGALTYVNIPTGANPNRSTAGALTLGQPSPTGSDVKYLLSCGIGALQNINWWMLVDIVAAAGNILATSSGSQTVTTPALTRYTTGAGVMATLECTTQTSATAHNFTLNSYTDQGGNTGHTTGAQTMTSSATAMIVQRLFPVDTGMPFFSLASGDYGIRAVANATCSAALGAGVYAINLAFPLMLCPGIAAGTFVVQNTLDQLTGLDELVKGSDSEIGCLGIYVMTNTTSTGVVAGKLECVRG